MAEANRVLLAPSADGTCEAEIDVKPRKYGVGNQKQYKIRFDIVDTANLYWLGREDRLRIYSDAIRYIDDPVRRIL